MLPMHYVTATIVCMGLYALMCSKDVTDLLYIYRRGTILAGSVINIQMAATEWRADARTHAQLQSYT